MEANVQQMKAVYTVVERGSGKSYWTRVGVGFVNRDGSITLKLDAVPVNGTLQVREWESREDGARGGGGSGGGRGARGAGGGSGGGGGDIPFGDLDPESRPPRRPRREEPAGGAGARRDDLTGLA